MNFTLRPSLIDPKFLELVQGEAVIQEIEAILRKSPPSFATPDEALTWLQETEYKTAKAMAYRWIALRSLSKKALADKLRIKRFSPTLTEEIVLELEQLGYLNDADYFTRAIESLSQKGYGAHYIAQKLNLNPHTVRTTLGPKEAASCRKIIAKYKDKQQALRALLRRGFHIDTIRTILSIENTGENE